MAGETVITVIGNLTADPELRWTQSGAAVADFTVASTPRTYDRNAGEWRDGDTLFIRCSVWRETAENVAESLRKGMRVIVQGRRSTRSAPPCAAHARRSPAFRHSPRARAASGQGLSPFRMRGSTIRGALLLPRLSRRSDGALLPGLR